MRLVCKARMEQALNPGQLVEYQLVSSVQFDPWFSVNTFGIQIGTQLTLGPSPVASSLAQPAYLTLLHRQSRFIRVSKMRLPLLLPVFEGTRHSPRLSAFCCPMYRHCAGSHPHLPPSLAQTLPFIGVRSICQSNSGVRMWESGHTRL